MYAAYIAGCYLRRRAIAYMAVAAVTLAVMVLIVVISVMDGFQNQIKKNIRGTQSHITIENEEARHDLLARLQEAQIENVAAISARLTQPVLLDLGSSASGKLEFGVVVGIDPAGESSTTDFREYLMDFSHLEETYDDVDPKVIEHIRRVADFKDGKTATPFPTHGPGKESRFAGIIISKVTAISLGLRVGKRLGLATVPRGQLAADPAVGNRDRLKPKRLQFLIVGIYDTHEYDFSSRHIYMAMADAQDFLETVAPSEILVKLDDYALAEETKRALQQYIDEEIGAFAPVSTWEDRKRNLLDAIEVERRIMIILLFFVFVVAGFMIWSILHSMAQEKIRDLGILSAMGATGSGVLCVFLACGFLIGLVGAGLGTTLGVVLALNLDNMDKFSKAHFGMQIFPEAVYGFDHIPVAVTPHWCAIVASMGFCCALFSSLWPAWRASRMDPVEALRSE